MTIEERYHGVLVARLVAGHRYDWRLMRWVMLYWMLDWPS